MQSHAKSMHGGLVLDADTVAATMGSAHERRMLAALRRGGEQEIGTEAVSGSGGEQDMGTEAVIGSRGEQEIGTEAVSGSGGEQEIGTQEGGAGRRDGEGRLEEQEITTRNDEKNYDKVWD